MIDFLLQKVAHGLNMQAWSGGGGGGGGSLFSEGGPRAMRAQQNMQWLGGSGGMPSRRFLNFRRSKIDSVAFWDTFLS